MAGSKDPFLAQPGPHFHRSVLAPPCGGREDILALASEAALFTNAVPAPHPGFRIVMQAGISVSPAAGVVVQERTPRWALMQRLFIGASTQGREETEARLDRREVEGQCWPSRGLQPPLSSPSMSSPCGSKFWTFMS